MNKAADIYWDNSRRVRRTVNSSTSVRRRRTSVKAERRRLPWWVSFLIVTSIFVMICVSINFRAFSEMQHEVDQNVRLASQIQSLMDENLALQEEIHSLKTDPHVIGREAKRIGLGTQREKVPVPAN